MMNKRGQAGAFVGIIMLIIAFVILFIALPFVNSFIDVTAANSGTATTFVIRLFPWVIFVFLLLGGLRLIMFGGGE